MDLTEKMDFEQRSKEKVYMAFLGEHSRPKEQPVQTLWAGSGSVPACLGDTGKEVSGEDWLATQADGPRRSCGL